MSATFAVGYAVTKSSGAGAGGSSQRSISFSAPSRKKIASFGFIPCSISRSFRAGFLSTCSITKCCIPSCRRKRTPRVGGAFIPKNFIDAKKRIRATGAPGAGKTKTSRASCASRLTNLRRGRPLTGLRRRWCRRYVLLDEIPERGREEEGGQLRAPVVQDQFLHESGGVKLRRGAAEMSRALNSVPGGDDD